LSCRKAKSFPDNRRRFERLRENILIFRFGGDERLAKKAPKEDYAQSLSL
jgi:hypothetical protein